MRRLRLRTMFLIGIVALVVPLLWQIGPAGATTGSYSDPRPCSATVNNGVCISQVSAVYGSSTITLSMTVGAATDPTTDPGWQNGFTFDGWNIGVDGALTPTYVAVGEGASMPGTFSGEVGQDFRDHTGMRRHRRRDGCLRGVRQYLSGEFSRLLHRKSVFHRRQRGVDCRQHHCSVSGERSVL